MQRTVTLMVIGVFLVVASGALAQETVKLEYKFQRDHPLKYRLNMSNKATFTMPDGSVQHLNMKTYIELTQELIEKKADGTYRIAVSIDKATQIVNGNNSPLPSMPPTLVTMKKNGEIVGAAAQGPAPGTQQLQMIFPSKPITEGESWIQEQKIEQPLPLLTKTKYTLVKAQAPFPGYPRPVVHIKNRMKLKNMKTATNEEVSSETRGNLWFDLKRGCIVRSKAHSDFTFNLPINVPGMIPEGAKVKVQLKMQLEISLIE